MSKNSRPFAVKFPLLPRRLAAPKHPSEGGSFLAKAGAKAGPASTLCPLPWERWRPAGEFHFSFSIPQSTFGNRQSAMAFPASTHLTI
jgi:hypothetical protein